MRVAIFTDTYYQINGVSMVYNRFARWCADKGYNIEIFTPGTSQVEEIGSVKIHGIDMILPIPVYRDLRFDVFPFRRQVVDYFLKNRFDLIHIATQGHMAILGLKVADKSNLPKISCYHTAIPEYAHSRFIKVLGNNLIGRWMADRAADLSWWYQRKLYMSSSLILVPTNSIKEMIDRETGRPSALFTRGVDSDAFSPHRGKKNMEGDPVSLFVGRISIEKNLRLLTQLGSKRGRNLIFVGDGPYTKTLKKILPEATYTGFLKGEDLQRAFASADIFVFPSKTDTFGNAVLEAMSSGLPVIVTDQMGPKDFVKHGVTGFIAAGDKEFIDYHRMLVVDTELRERMGRNAREYAKSCNWDAIFETQLIGNYRKVINEAADA